ncbi:MAG TPA: DUF4386 family protein [Nocardioidaceae bacterium]|nr:DUF4386 family protein [Nocardioidaceae bacterium]
MTGLTDTPDFVDTTSQRRTLARITGAAGLITIVVVLGSSIANDYQSASFTSDADETVTFFQSLDDSFGAFSSFATAVGLIAMLWFALGLALLLRRYDGELPWRTTFLAGAGVVSVVSGQIASWDAAAYRSDDLDPQVSQYAFDLGNLSFANSWVAAGAVGICAGLLVLRSRDLPQWLGWWAILAGVGSVLARAVWTESYAFIPVTALWVWITVASVMLLVGRFAVTGSER